MSGIVHHLLVILASREEVTSGTETRRDKTIRGENALGLPRRYKPADVRFSVPRRLVGVSRVIVEVAALALLRPADGFGGHEATHPGNCVGAGMEELRYHRTSFA